MRIAFVILAYSSGKQLERVIDRLDRPQHSFIIHIDKRRDDVYEDAKTRLGRRGNVHFVERIKVWWGHFNLTLAVVEAMRYLVVNRIAYDYATLLSEADYPIKPVEHMERFLEQHAGKNFLHHALNEAGDHPWVDTGEPGSERWAAKPRMENWHLIVRSHTLLRLPLKRRPPFGFVPYTGWLWWTLTRECVEYAVGFLVNHSRYVRFFRHVSIADEFFFQTLLLNSPLRGTVVADNLRFVHEEPFPNHIKTVQREQFEALRLSPALFARKFDFRGDPGLLDMVDEQLLSAAPSASVVRGLRNWKTLTSEVRAVETSSCAGVPASG